MCRDALYLDQPKVERFRIVDKTEAALWCDQFGDLREMVPRHVGAKHKFDRRDIERGDLRSDRFRVVEYVVGAVFTAPFPFLLIVERRGHDSELCELPRELHGHRSDATGATDDQHRRTA